MESGFTHEEANSMEVSAPEFVSEMERLMTSMVPGFTHTVTFEGKLDQEGRDLYSWYFEAVSPERECVVCKPVSPTCDPIVVREFVTRAVAFEMNKQIGNLVSRKKEQE